MQDNMNKVPVSDRLDKVVAESLTIINRKHRKTVFRRVTIGVSSMAAAAALFLTVCVTNPVFASNLPLIGRIFEKAQNEVSYKGDFSSQSDKLIPEDASEAESDYVKTSNGITVSVSEVHYNSAALYMAMSIKNDAGFPDDFMKKENMEGYILDYDTLGLNSIGKASFFDGEVNVDNIEGQFQDKNTFLGIVRVDMSNLVNYPSPEEIEAAGINFDDEAELLKAFPEAGKAVEVPDSFTYNLNLTQIWSELLVTSPDTVLKRYDGDWNFQFDVSIDKSKTQMVEVNKTNDEGVGIANVQKTPYELTVDTILPDGQSSKEYFTVMCDANGDLLDSQGGNAGVYQAYLRDTSKVYVYICDYNKYMNELKGYYWSDDYDQKKLTKTFAQYLEENALYGSEVVFNK